MKNNYEYQSTYPLSLRERAGVRVKRPSSYPCQVHKGAGVADTTFRSGFHSSRVYMPPSREMMYSSPLPSSPNDEIL